jgi:hypothetical protein
MKNKLWFYVLGGVGILIVYVFTVVGIANLMRPNAVLPEQAAVSPQPSPTPPSPSPSKTPRPSPIPSEVTETAESSTTYIVKEDNGKVYVYVEGDPTPQKTLNINLQGLRQYDRELFAEGIVLHSTEELAQLEEDFSEY